MTTFEQWQEFMARVEIDGLAHAYVDVPSTADTDAPPVLLLHGYPTWSYDWVDVTGPLSVTHRVVAPDWLGYGLSDKPARHVPITEQIDRLETLLQRIGVDRFHLVAHDYGATCAQEMLSRPGLAARVESLTLMNGGLIYEAYRPTRTQRLLLTPLGPLVARLLGKDRLRAKLDAVRGVKLRNDQWEALWAGMTEQDGLKKTHLLQRYITERAQNHERWDAALRAYAGPVQLIWGPLDPISGAHVLEPLRSRLSEARVVELPGIGHFVPDEAPDEVSRTILEFIA